MFNFIVLGLSLIIFIGLEDVVAPTIETSLSTDQMVSDWQVVPFVDVVAGANDGTCPEGYEGMFTNLWQGTVKGVLIQETSTGK